MFCKEKKLAMIVQAPQEYFRRRNGIQISDFESSSSEEMVEVYLEAVQIIRKNLERTNWQLRVCHSSGFEVQIGELSI